MSEVGRELVVIGFQVGFQRRLEQTGKFLFTRAPQSAQCAAKIGFRLQVTFGGVQPVLFGEKLKLRNL